MASANGSGVPAERLGRVGVLRGFSRARRLLPRRVQLRRAGVSHRVQLQARGAVRRQRHDRIGLLARLNRWCTGALPRVAREERHRVDRDLARREDPLGAGQRSITISKRDGLNDRNQSSPDMAPAAGTMNSQLAPAPNS